MGAKIFSADSIQNSDVTNINRNREWRSVFFGARTRILAWYFVLMACSTIVTIIAIRQRLTQAVMNLAQNATQHTTDSNIIALGSALTDGMACFWVRDTGEGIPLAEQSRIFERFARSMGRRRSEGAGLGLAIVRAIAEAHGGWIELSSQPGRGSTFTIVIPLYSPKRLF